MVTVTASNYHKHNRMWNGEGMLLQQLYRSERPQPMWLRSDVVSRWTKCNCIRDVRFGHLLCHTLRSVGTLGRHKNGGRFTKW